MTTPAHTCTHKHTHAHISTQAHTWTHMHTHGHTYAHTCTHMHTYVWRHMHTHAHRCTHMHAHAYTGTHIHTHAYTGTHMHTNARRRSRQLHFPSDYTNVADSGYHALVLKINAENACCTIQRTTIDSRVAHSLGRPYLTQYYHRADHQPRFSCGS